jgi:hypothetical protein
LAVNIAYSPAFLQNKIQGFAIIRLYAKIAFTLYAEGSLNQLSVFNPVSLQPVECGNSIVSMQKGDKKNFHRITSSSLFY